MKIIKSIAFCIAFLALSLLGYCQYASLDFVENKGQWEPQVKFKGVLNNGAFFLQEKGFRVLLNHPEDMKHVSAIFHGEPTASMPKSGAKPLPVTDGPPEEEKVMIRSHAYDVTFVNAGDPTPTPEKPLQSYNNYLVGNDPAKWQGHCKIYQAVNFKNMYRGVDVRYYTDEGKLKYDLIVQPDADVSAIAMRYDGVDGLDIRNGQLIIKTSVGEVKELAPYAYQVIDGVKKTVNCRFRIDGNTVYFVLGAYSKTAPLVIDPTLIFSTFTGSSAFNWGYTATYGPDESFYSGGIVFSQGFPVNPGAFQTTFNGGARDEENLSGYDIGIMKFDPLGTNRVYATYIGGSRNEQPHSLVVDRQGNLIIAGRSNSDNYPQRGGALIGGGGNYDIIVTKLNASGSNIIGSRRVGGGGYDGVNIRPKYAAPKGVESIRRNYGDDARSEVVLDANDNILVASNTQSNNFPLVSAFQSSYSGRQAGVFLKFNTDLTALMVSSFAGCTDGDNAAFVLAISPLTQNIYVGGNTSGRILPGDKSGVVGGSNTGGPTEGFVQMLSPSGAVLLKSTFAGTNGADMLYGVQCDKYGFPYITGTTTGNWPVINARYSTPGAKQFIAKLKPDLTGYVYSTTFGTPNSFTPNISTVAFLVDRCENVYVSGWGGAANTAWDYERTGTRGLPVTPDAIQATTDNSDFYFFVLERDATSQLYGSFFGQVGGYGEHVDGGTSRFDRNGVIYQAMCANCGRDVMFPTSPGVWAPINGSDECNLAAVKIAFNLSGVAGSLKTSIIGQVSDTSGCVPLTVIFTDTLNQGRTYKWSFGDGSRDTITSTNSLSHTFTAIGDYRVRLIAVDSSTCNVSDTAYVNIKVRTYKGVLDFTAKKIGNCQATDYEFNNISYVDPALRNFTATSFRWNFGDGTISVVAGLGKITHSFPRPGRYVVTLSLIDTNFCNAPDVLTKVIRVASNVKAVVATAATGCAPYNAVIQNRTDGGEKFFWSFGDGTTSTEESPFFIHHYPTPGSYTIRLTVIDSNTCNIIDSTSFNITVFEGPTAAFTFTPNPPQENTPVTFINNSVDAVRYEWNFGDDEKLSTESLEPVEHTYNRPGPVIAQLIAVNIKGCPDTAKVTLVARVAPLLDVPNAFTPNGDGINDKVFVRGFGITKMTWRIYNRWGQVVFQTNDRKEGWDGKFKGQVQPQEVYHYVLDVEYSDKTIFQKKGDITLLR